MNNINIYIYNSYSIAGERREKGTGNTSHTRNQSTRELSTGTIWPRVKSMYAFPLHSLLAAVVHCILSTVVQDATFRLRYALLQAVNKLLIYNPYTFIAAIFYCSNLRTWLR